MPAKCDDEQPPVWKYTEIFEFPTPYILQFNNSVYLYMLVQLHY
jgi:hypothetical protein